MHLATQPAKLSDALRGLPALGFSGCNITIPHKVSAMNVVDRVDAHATRVGAINTVVVEPDGSLTGFNHDGFGFMHCLRDAQPDWQAMDGPVAVYGAGGAARAIVASLVDLGAPEVRLVNRSPDAAASLAHDMGAAVRPVPWSERHDAMSNATLVVNTTSQGMQGQAALDLELDALPRQCLVADIVYTPLETPLLAAARQRGNITVNGLGMLIHQARPAFKAWFGVMPQATPELWNLMRASVQTG